MAGVAHRSARDSRLVGVWGSLRVHVLSLKLRNCASLLGIATLAVTFGCGDDGPSGGGTAGTGTDGGADTQADSSAGVDETGSDTNCGNGVLDENEECEGTDLGGMECTDVHSSFIGGTLTCGANCSFDASGCEADPTLAFVTLNEVTSDAVLEGEFAGPNDAVELINAGSVTADIAGWQISDDVGFLPEKTYTFPADTTIEAGEFLVLRSIDLKTMVGELPFGLDKTGQETLFLNDADGEEVASVLVDGFLARDSYCRVEDAQGPWIQCEQTFGALNVAAETPCGNAIAEGLEECDGEDFGGATCESLGLGFTEGALSCTQACNVRTDNCATDSQIVINEVEATFDNIELYNGSDGPADISGWVLTDKQVDADYDVATDTDALTFAPGTVLAPGEYLVVFLGLGANEHPFGLDIDGDSVGLVTLDPVTVVDQVVYADGEATFSYCRLPDGPGGEWTADCDPTMGVPNN